MHSRAARARRYYRWTREARKSGRRRQHISTVVHRRGRQTDRGSGVHPRGLRLHTVDARALLLKMLWSMCFQLMSSKPTATCLFVTFQTTPFSLQPLSSLILTRTPTRASSLIALKRFSVARGNSEATGVTAALMESSLANDGGIAACVSFSCCAITLRKISSTISFASLHASRSSRAPLNVSGSGGPLYRGESGTGVVRTDVVADGSRRCKGSVYRASCSWTCKRAHSTQLTWPCVASRCKAQNSR